MVHDGKAVVLYVRGAWRHASLHGSEQWKPPCGMWLSLASQSSFQMVDGLGPRAVKALECLYLHPTSVCTHRHDLLKHMHRPPVVDVMASPLPRHLRTMAMLGVDLATDADVRYVLSA